MKHGNDRHMPQAPDKIEGRGHDQPEHQEQEHIVENDLPDRNLLLGGSLALLGGFGLICHVHPPCSSMRVRGCGSLGVFSSSRTPTHNYRIATSTIMPRNNT